MSLKNIETDIKYTYDRGLDQQQMTLDQINAQLKTFTSANNESVNIEVVFKKPVGSMQDFGLRVASDGTKFTTVGYTKNNEIFVDRSLSGDTLDPRGGFTNQNSFKILYDLSNNVNVMLQVVVDRNSVEAIFDETYSMTNLIFPDYRTQKGIEIWTKD